VRQRGWFRVRLRPVILAIVVAALVQPTAALAGKATKASDHFVEFGCDQLTTSAGNVFLGAFVSDVNGADAFLDFFAAPDEPYTVPPTLSRDFDQAVSLSGSSAGVTGTIPLVDANGDAAGSATLNAAFEASGPPEAIDDSFRNGNQTFRQTGTFTPLSVSGTVTLPGAGSFALDNCSGDEQSITFFGTNPNAFTAHFESSQVGCDLENSSGRQGFLFVDLSTDFFIEAILFAQGGFDTELDAVGTAQFSGSSINQSLDTFDANGDPAGQTGLSLTIAATGERFDYTMRNATSFRRARGDAFDVSGSLAFPNGVTFDLGNCVAVDQRFKEVDTSPKGPKPTGKPPANDLPSGAQFIKAGTTVTEQTKNASLLNEEPFACLTGEDENGNPVFLPVINTVWFRFQGSGQSMTLDTAGSSFDTVLAVYTRDSNGAYVPVDGGCVDDVPLQPVGRTLQAAVTLPTGAGTTYYVQVGGFPDNPNFGTLKLGLR
jgi:hypothetical protein